MEIVKGRNYENINVTLDGILKSQNAAKII